MRKNTILIVDDDLAFAGKLTKVLEGLFDVEVCHSEADFRQRFAVGCFDLIIMDMRLKEDREGIELLSEVFVQDPSQAAIVMTAYADTASYADALASGALTYLDKKEFSPQLIARTVEAILQQALLQRQVEALQHRLDTTESSEIIGASPAIQKVRNGIRDAADNSGSLVLIVGESGSGRSLVARNIHRLSRLRSQGPFVAVSCTGFGQAELEQNLFGGLQHTKSDRTIESKGFIDRAKEGILYLHGLMQANESLLTRLEELVRTAEFRRKDAKKTITAEMQLIVSVPPDSQSYSETFDFLASSLHTNVIEIHVPPLCERVEDISLIAQYTLQRLYRKGETRARSFTGAAIGILESLPWPGNVRELESAAEYASIRADATGVREIGPEHLPQCVSETWPPFADVTPTLDYQMHLARAELALVESAITNYGFTRQIMVAKKLQYNDRFTFSRRIRSHLKKYPALGGEYPHVKALFSSRTGAR